MKGRQSPSGTYSMMSPGWTSNRSQMRRMVFVVTDSPLESLAMMTVV